MNNAASNSGLINVPKAEHLAVVILPQHLCSPELENTLSLSLPPRPAIDTDRLDQLQAYPPPLLKKTYPCY